MGFTVLSGAVLAREAALDSYLTHPALTSLSGQKNSLSED
jgi:hypothetical protein